MRNFLVVLCALAIIFAASCTKSAPPTKVETTRLLERFKETGAAPKVTVLFFVTRGCQPNMVPIRDFLQGLENLSGGGVKFFEVDAEVDKEGKKAYGVISFPTVLFFNEAGELKDRRGPSLDMETAKKIVTGLGATVKEVKEEVKEPGVPDEHG
jgi:hypothetical protein